MILQFIIGLAVIITDQLSKFIVEKRFHVEESMEIIKGVLRFTYVRNKGTAFGAFQGMIPVITLMSVIAVIAIIFYFYRKNEEHSLLTKLGFTLIISGAVGNLYDRIFRGYVVDFFDFYGIWHFIFNVADVAINIGLFLMIIEFFIDKETPNEIEKNKSENTEEISQNENS